MDIHQVKKGMIDAFPIVLGYLPVGMAFGLLARQAGLTPAEIGLMSLLVYAGASQFIAVEMILKGILWAPILITTFLINLRHFLMSSTLSLYFKRNQPWILTLLSVQLTDESFAMAMSNPGKIENRPQYLFGLQCTSHLAWITGSVLGAFFGRLIHPQSYGIPFALPALFICLLMLQVRSTLHFSLMGVAGALSLLFKSFLPGNWYIIPTALITSGLGVMMQEKIGPWREGLKGGTGRE